MEDFGDILKDSGLFTQAAEPQQVQEPKTEPQPPQQAAPALTPEPAQQQQAAPEPVVTQTAAPQTDPATEYFKKFGFKDEEEVKSSLNELNTLREASVKRAEDDRYYQELEKAYEELASKDESSLFGSPEEYKNFLIAQKLGLNRDHGVVQKIIRSNLDQLDDLEVLSLRDQYDIPRFAGKDDKVKRALLEEIGVDINDPEFKLETYREHLTEDQDLRLARMANQTRDVFNQAKGDVKIPERVDPKVKLQDRIKQQEEGLNQLVKSWRDNADKVSQEAVKVSFVDKNDKGEVVDEFHYDVDKEFKESIPDIVDNFITQNRVQYTQENVKAVTKLILDAYKVQNLDKIIRAARNEARTTLREQIDKQRFNGQSINTATAPPNQQVNPNDEINSVAKLLAGGL